MNMDILKKILLMPRQMIKAIYNPENIENKWYSQWQEKGCFAKKIDHRKDSFCILMPPPNVTGVLHMGHLLNNTLQDVLIRRARQLGKSTLWIPGTDHAGIATQVKVEKELMKEGKIRQNIGRESFIQRALHWRDKHGGLILEQLKKLGISCNWDAKVHTLDPGYNLAVQTAFIELYNRGYIYRGKRMVNWCPVSLTALSDEEVMMKPQQCMLYHLKYELTDGSGFIEVATTRPETIMGDTAIAVNPNDDRYRSLIGKTCLRPLKKAEIRIIADEAVDQDFGSGALKVTPAHSAIDFEIGQRHRLEFLDIMNPDGTLNSLAGNDFEGMDRFEARVMAVEKLRKLGLLIKEELYSNNVGFSERANVPIEPKLSEQWFLKYPKVEEAKAAILNGVIKLRPERWTKTYLHWLDNIKDWCISRQLWWGHRIPVWYRKGYDKNDPTNIHLSIDGPEDKENWEQDPDVLDTWFSSALWPFATFGWPDLKKMEEKNFDYFYPTSDLVTGPDIIFFWVTRMIIASLELLGANKNHLLPNEIQERIPFKNVYFTGIIRDKLGRKMSKSLGNSPEPLDLIKKYGADGLRFGLLSMAPQGQDVLFSEERVEFGRNFCNKLWNAFRFRQTIGEEQDKTIEGIFSRINPKEVSLIDLAILTQMLKTLIEFEEAMAEYEFNKALQIIYSFFWKDFCDWYLEVSKINQTSSVIGIYDLILRQCLLILHPFIPFITEELWHMAGYGTGFINDEKLDTSANLLANIKALGLEPAEDSILEVAMIRELISSTRAMKANYGLAAKKDMTFYYKAADGQTSIIAKYNEIIKHFIGAAKVIETNSLLDLPVILTPAGLMYLDLASQIDLASEKQKVIDEIQKITQLIAKNQSKLNDKVFISKAPQQIIDGTKKLLEENLKKQVELQSLLDSLNSLKT
ncbi:MAG: valine--tRNA ligase [Puniceicoccales bacterium]|jgi:valyl-tRNA synthetase|nr:valine--tRNA ligase [Puniceicoccales bacterium]